MDALMELLGATIALVGFVVGYWLQTVRSERREAQRDREVALARFDADIAGLYRRFVRLEEKS
jgi:hypothetical protein